MASNVAKNQLPFPACIASIDQRVHILPFDEPGQKLQPRFGFLDGVEVKMRWNDRQIRKTPFPSLDFVFRRDRELKQMPYGRRHDIFIVLEVVRMFRESTQSPRNVGGN